MSRVPTLLRDTFSHPDWLLLFVFGRFPAARRLVAALVPNPGQAAAASERTSADALASASIPAVVATLRRHGICTGLRLPPATVEAIREFAESNPCFGGQEWRVGFLPQEHAGAERRHGSKLLVGLLPDPDRNCAAVAEVVRNRWLHAVAGEYLGAAPKVIDVRLWWSFPSSDPSWSDLRQAAQETFHFDLADWGQLKFFFYINDVGALNGPHVYVRGSHARRPLSHQFTLFVGKTDAEIAAAYGPDAIQTVTGPAGTGFAEDVFGFHKAPAIREGRRLALEVSFGITGRLRRRAFGEAAH
ncbi:MAG: hypothetical protein ICV73_09320 [Acetobacteraceae bacterium]|nr:hypothetical protein [Acetobacteraceae bacterium]